jgi:CYTH domain-containing protein
MNHKQKLTDLIKKQIFSDLRTFEPVGLGLDTLLDDPEIVDIIDALQRPCTRAEYEYPIPVDECNAMLDTLAEKPLIEKKRYRIKCGELVWEIDEFFGDNKGLIVAEVELQSEDQPFDKPSWLGQEVSGDPRYFNSNLIGHPFTKW